LQIWSQCMLIVGAGVYIFPYPRAANSLSN
jgi:hypothetical protein